MISVPAGQPSVRRVWIAGSYFDTYTSFQIPVSSSLDQMWFLFYLYIVLQRPRLEHIGQRTFFVPESSTQISINFDFLNFVFFSSFFFNRLSNFLDIKKLDKNSSNYHQLCSNKTKMKSSNLHQLCTTKNLLQAECTSFALPKTYYRQTEHCSMESWPVSGSKYNAITAGQ